MKIIKYEHRYGVIHHWGLVTMEDHLVAGEKSM
jgi:hypothetical protein